VTYEMMETAFRPPARTGARPDWHTRTIDAAKNVVSSTLDRVNWNAELVRGIWGSRSAAQAGAIPSRGSMSPTARQARRRPRAAGGSRESRGRERQPTLVAVGGGAGKPGGGFERPKPEPVVQPGLEAIKSAPRPSPTRQAVQVRPGGGTSLAQLNDFLGGVQPGAGNGNRADIGKGKRPNVGEGRRPNVNVGGDVNVGGGNMINYTRNQQAWVDNRQPFVSNRNGSLQSNAGEEAPGLVHIGTKDSTPLLLVRLHQPAENQKSQWLA
jgi:hypothetical protein